MDGHAGLMEGVLAMAKVAKRKPRSRRALHARRAAEESGLKGLRGFLARQEKDRLVELLVGQALVDDHFFQTLEFERAKGEGREPNLAALRRTLAAAFDPGDVYSYDDVYSYAAELHQAVDVLQDLAKQGQAREVIDLAEYALTLTEKALGEVEDSDGEVYVVLERLRDLHLEACKKARPDPAALARRLFAWEMRTDWDSFYGAADTYAGVLGKKGLAVYRELAEAEWRQLLARKPGADWQFDARRSRLAHILESLARSAGDLEALVAIKSHDLSRASAFLDVAQIYKEAGKSDLALEWAEKGVRAFPQRTDPRLRSFLAGEYKARRRHEEAIALIWANFTDGPGLASYQDLKKYAERAGIWSGWREKALGVLRDLARQASRRSPSLRPAFEFEGSPASRLVEILLWEKKEEEAWQAAQQFGCSEELWFKLAKLREGAHPEEALAVYQRQVEAALQQVSQQGYEVAVARLRRIRDVMKRSGKTREFATYLASLRLAHKRKRNFVSLLNAAKLE